MGLQAVFGLEPTMVHVIAPDVGGGFGPKFGNYPEDVVTAWVARRIGRAARWTETRSESMVALHHGRAQAQTVTLGGTRDGDLLAYHLDVEQDAGAYASLGVYVPEATLRMTTGVYTIPRAHGTARATDVGDDARVGVPGERPPRGHCRYRARDRRLRAEIAMDPVDLRRRNLVGASAFPFTTPVGTVYDTGDYEAALDTLVTESGYEKLRAEQRTRGHAAIGSSSGSACRCTSSRPPPAPGWSSAPSPCGPRRRERATARHRRHRARARTVRATTPRSR